ncbi:serine hydrolase domain-containing protein [Mycolicibacterium sp.]|uniref:serine hydrolase domain-containing protein n=1 Tax=Mycolicibacterium sp. TaxID=2320850 RepID=UPI003D103572
MVSPSTVVAGHVDPAFRPVADAFAANFDDGLEVGATCAVVIAGQPVVDLWGGVTDEGPHATAWERDTLVNLMSVSKGILAIVTHMLCDRGVLDLDAPVARYWPEFATHGKDQILVRHVLDHTAGLEVLTEPLWPGAAYDWTAMVRALENQSPLHAAGTRPAYHTVTMSFLAGELIRRITGTSYGQALRDLITGPLAADFHVGLGGKDMARCARFLRWHGYNAQGHGSDEPSSLLVAAWAQFDPADDWNSTAFRRSEIPGVNGHGNARAVAAIYGALCTGALMSAETLQRATELQWSATEPVLLHNYRMGLGFTLNSPDAYMGPNPRAFGHVGAGGSTGLCDPDLGLGFSYGMNRMYPSRDNGPRARRLLEALYQCL